MLGLRPRSTSPSRTALGLAVVAATAVAAVLPSLATPASAVRGPLVVESTDTNRVAPGATTALTGLSITGNDEDALQATLSTDVGTLAISTQTGLTLAFGNAWSGTSSITFTGMMSDINNGLATAEITTPGGDGVANVSLTASLEDASRFYLPSNQRFYEYVDAGSIDWVAADVAARASTFRGQPGYLAAPVNSTINDFLANKIPDADDIWIGLRAYANSTVDGVSYPRVWRATVGADQSPEQGNVVSICSNTLDECTFVDRGSYFESWSTGEPNNSGGTEDAAVTNWNNSTGLWNDLNPATTSPTGYVIEYGGKTNVDDPSIGTGFTGVTTDTSEVIIANAPTAPDAPVLSGAAADESIDLSWRPPSNGGDPITSYESSVDGGAWEALATSSETTSVDGNLVTTVSGTIAGLDNGTEYEVRVRAVNGEGPSEASNTIAATPVGVPDAPTAVSGTAADGSVEVSFTAPADDGGAAITGYTATADPGGATGTCISSPCTVTGLDNGTAYTFTVTATNSVGTSAASTASSEFTPRTMPDAATNLVATPGNGSVSIAFTAPADDGGATVLDYTVTAAPDGAANTCAGSPCVVSGLTNGTEYTFSATARNAAGSGPASATTTSTPRTMPGVPVIGSVTPTSGAVQVEFSAPADDGGSAILDYTVTATPGDHTATCATSPCSIGGLSNGATYSFTVAARNVAGSSAGSLPVDTTPFTVPDPPTSVSASQNGVGSVVVSFDAPLWNGGSPIAEYLVAATQTGFSPLCSDKPCPGFGDVAAVCLGGSCSDAVVTCAASPCTISGLETGGTYEFAASAVNAAGDGAPSATSTSITLLGLPTAPAEVEVTATATSVTVAFDDSSDTITSYTVVLEPGPITTTCTSSPCEIGGLTPGVDYSITALANGPAGSSPADDPVVVRTDRSTGGFVPMRPSRALDSRSTARFSAGEVREIDLAGVEGLPNDATSVIVNLTAVNPDASGFMSVVPCGTTNPTTSNVNFVAGVDVAGSAIVDLSDGTTICVYTHVGTDVVVDVNGAISATAGESRLLAIEPRRAIDTREIGQTVAADSIQRVSLAGIVPTGADAVVLNATVIDARSGGYATVFDCDGDAPTASNLNFVSGQTVPNAVTTEVGEDTQICVYSLAEIDLVVDVMGYYAVDPTVDAIVAVDAERLLDTRESGARVAAGESIVVDIPDRDGRSPVTAVVNLTSTQSATTGYLTAYPCSAAPPLASNVNMVPGVDTANSATVITDDDGRICIFASADTHVIVDLLGLQY